MSGECRILVLEDAHADGEVIRGELDRAGYVSASARVESRAALVEQLEEFSPSLIVTDSRFPPSGSQHALDLVMEHLPSIPVVKVTEPPGGDVVPDWMYQSASDAIAETPLQQLTPAIRRLLEAQRHRAEKEQTEARLRHLNGVLQAMRSVAQLIVREEDRGALLQGACDILAGSRGCHGAWIALLDDSQEPTTTAHAGSGEDFAAVAQPLQRGELPPCGVAALGQPQVVVIDAPNSTCSDCPVPGSGSEHRSLTARIEHEGKVYGLLSVHLSPGLVQEDEETGLFCEVVADVAFALHRLELDDQRRQMGAALQYQADLLQHISEAVISTDSGFKIRSWNKAADSMYGWQRREVIGRPLSEVVRPDYPGTTPDQVLDQLNRTGRFAGEVVHHHRDGSPLHGWGVITLLRDSRGNPNGAVSVNRDVTENRQMQTRLLQADRLASMGMLAAGVAHEINNPLTYVLYSLESVLDELRNLRGAAPPARLDDLIERARDATEGAHRVRNIVRDLRTFSRVEEDRQVPVSIHEVMEAAVNMTYNEIKYRARLVKQYGDIPHLMANDGRLSQVFLNLLMNAAHAIDEGDVQHNQITVRTWSEQQEILVEVRDTGKGIPPEHLPRLFDPFFTTKPSGVGSGLGLAICRDIVVDHGGIIEVESVEGHGASFKIFLPSRQGH